MYALSGIAENKVVVYKLNAPRQVAAYLGINRGIGHFKHKSVAVGCGCVHNRPANAVLLENNKHILLLAGKAVMASCGITGEVILLLRGKIPRVHSNMVSVPKISIGLVRATAKNNAKEKVLALPPYTIVIIAIHYRVIQIDVTLFVSKLNGN